MSDSTHVYIGSYPTEEAAVADLGVVRDMCIDDVIRPYDSAILVKDATGRIHVRRREETAKRPAGAGAAIGALVDVVFPGGGSGTARHLWRDISREDLGVLGELLGASRVTLVVVSTSGFDDAFAARRPRAPGSARRTRRWPTPRAPCNWRGPRSPPCRPGGPRCTCSARARWPP